MRRFGIYAAIHLVACVALWGTGRAGLAPGIIDPGGFLRMLAPDLTRVDQATELAGLLARGDGHAWLALNCQAHVKLYSLSFFALSRWLGPTVLCAEPINLPLYLALLALCRALGRTLGGSGAAPMLAVALWPSLLLTTLQLARDPLFLVLFLGLLLIECRWLVGEDGLGRGILLGVLGGVLHGLLWIVRWDVQELYLGTAALCALLLGLRCLRGRRLLRGNLAGVAVLLALCACAPRLTQQAWRAGTWPQGWGGLAYTRAAPRPCPGTWACLSEGAQRLAYRADYLRAKFLRKYSAGLAIDPDVRFPGPGALLRYLPRAGAIGLFAPFPWALLHAPARAGLAGRWLAGAEMLALYAAEALAVLHLCRPRPGRGLALALLAVTAACGVIALGLAVPYLGTLYRLRYAYGILIMIIGLSQKAPARAA